MVSEAVNVYVAEKEKEKGGKREARNIKMGCLVKGK
jgi:hypothetical protein